jgi:predicted unusual protein kinase regulating ubiquinone biosynthesis (AarF/ABC1/UbiB family)
VADVLRSRTGRALRLGGLGARVAVAQGRRLFTGASTVHRDVARTLVRELGGLKGLPMKIGQLLSYMDGLVPDEHAALYREILGELRTHSRPVAEADWRAVFEEELGAAPEACFDAFDPAPIASASIGQVFRALLDGRAVCVKVQHPGIAEATASDLANLDAVVAVLRAVMPRVDTRTMVEDFRQRLAEECDYRLEAAYQRRFRELWAGDRDLLVPEVVDARSTRRVLTTAFVDGAPFDRVVADDRRPEKNRIGVTLFRFAFGSLLRHGLFHADPHPGNLLCRVDGGTRLAVLDYGCVQPIAEDARVDLVRMVEAALDGRDGTEAAIEALGLTDMDDATGEAVVAIVARVLAPITSPQPFRFAPDFGAALARDVVAAKQRLGLRWATGRGRFVADREGVMYVVRNLFGLASLWSALEAEADFQEVTRALVAAAPGD